MPEEIMKDRPGSASAHTCFFDLHKQVGFLLDRIKEENPTISLSIATELVLLKERYNEVVRLSSTGAYK